MYTRAHVYCTVCTCVEILESLNFVDLIFVDCTHHENITPTKISASTVGHVIELRVIKTDIAAFLQVQNVCVSNCFVINSHFVHFMAEAKGILWIRCII